MKEAALVECERDVRPRDSYSPSYEHTPRDQNGCTFATRSDVLHGLVDAVLDCNSIHCRVVSSSAAGTDVEDGGGLHRHAGSCDSADYCQSKLHFARNRGFAVAGFYPHDLDKRLTLPAELVYPLPLLTLFQLSERVMAPSASWLACTPALARESYSYYCRVHVPLCQDTQATTAMSSC